MQECLGQLAQFLQGHPLDGCGKEAGAAARHKRQQEIVRAQLAAHVQHPQGRRFAPLIRQGMAGLDDLDALRGQAVQIARDHQTGQRRIGRPMGLDRHRHAGGGFAAADHQRAAVRRPGQMRWQNLPGIRRVDRSLKRTS